MQLVLSRGRKRDIGRYMIYLVLTPQACNFKDSYLVSTCNLPLNFQTANLSVYLIGCFNNMVPPPPPNGRGADGGASVNENQKGGADKDSVFDQIAFSFHPSPRILLSPAHAGCSTHHYHRNYETNPVPHSCKFNILPTMTMFYRNIQVK
uniref:Uncharacterized protein n=1 Tax=Cucumis melo TaxID=3656 RepID=A0A9I9EEE0_CUCME